MELPSSPSLVLFTGVSNSQDMVVNLDTSDWHLVSFRSFTLGRLYSFLTALPSSRSGLDSPDFGYSTKELVPKDGVGRSCSSELMIAPPWYSTYRFYLSLVVGFSIMATFAGGGWYGAGAGASTAVSYPSRETYA